MVAGVPLLVWLDDDGGSAGGGTGGTDAIDWDLGVDCELLIDEDEEDVGPGGENRLANICLFFWKLKPPFSEADPLSLFSLLLVVLAGVAVRLVLWFVCGLLFRFELEPYWSILLEKE